MQAVARRNNTESPNRLSQGEVEVAGRVVPQRGKSTRNVSAADVSEIDRGGLEEAGSSEKATERQSVFTMVNAVLGAGVLGYPFCFKVCGMALATVLVFITVSAAEVSMRLLMVASQMSGKRTYEELAAHCFGKAGKSTVDLSITVLNMGSLVAYLNILADMFSLVANTIIPPGAEPSRNMLLTAITLGGALPMALFVKSPRLLSNVSQASVGFIFFFSLMIGLMALTSSPATSGVLALWEPSGILVAFPVIVYGFTAHQVLFSVYSSLRSASVTRMTNVIHNSMLLSSLVYMIVGACGYIAFGSRTAGDVLRNFGGPASTGLRRSFERFLKIGYGISILSTVPLIVMPLRSPFSALLGLKPDAGGALANPAHEQGVNSIIIALALALAILVPNIEYIFGLCGATVSVLISFILPAALYLRATSMQQGAGMRLAGPFSGPVPWRKRRRTAVALLLFGVLSGGACTQAMLQAVQEEAEVVQLAQELLKEKTKALKATETEKKVKEVAEAVGAVLEAQRQLGVAQEEAHATLGVVLQATEVLQAPPSSTAAAASASKWRLPRPQGGKEVQQVKADLQLVRQRVQSAVQSLESVAAGLGDAAGRLRNETAGMVSSGNSITEVTASTLAALSHIGGTSSAAAGLGSRRDDLEAVPGKQGAGTRGAPPPLSQQQAEQQQETDGSGAAAGAAQEEGGEGESSNMAAGNNGSKDGEDGKDAQSVAATLESMVLAANTTLSSLKDSQKALEAAHMATGKRWHKKEELMVALAEAVNATTAAAAQVNATVERLKQVEADKRSELVGVATQLFKEQEQEEARAAKQKELEDIEGLREGRAVVKGEEHTRTNGGGGSGDAEGNWGEGRMGNEEDEAGEGVRDTPSSSGDDMDVGAGSKAEGQEAGDAEGGGSSQGASAGVGLTEEERKKRERLKLVTSEAASNGTAGLNYTEVAAAAAEIAATAAQTAKSHVEHAIESKKTEVATRAIEIAKELAKETETQGLKRADGTTGSSSGGGNSSDAQGNVDLGSGEQGFWQRFGAAEGNSSSGRETVVEGGQGGGGQGSQEEAGKSEIFDRMALQLDPPWNNTRRYSSRKWVDGGKDRGGLGAGSSSRLAGRRLNGTRGASGAA